MTSKKGALHAPKCSRDAIGPSLRGSLRRSFLLGGNSEISKPKS